MPSELVARSEPCECWGGPPHRRLIVESDGGTLLSACEWGQWLWRQVMRYRDNETWPDPIWDALIAAGLKPTEPPSEWRIRVAAASDRPRRELAPPG